LKGPNNKQVVTKAAAGYLKALSPRLRVLVSSYGWCSENQKPEVKLKMLCGLKAGSGHANNPNPDGWVGPRSLTHTTQMRSWGVGFGPLGG
jgi:hypothetical protein